MRQYLVFWFYSGEFCSKTEVEVRRDREFEMMNY